MFIEKGDALNSKARTLKNSAVSAYNYVKRNKILFTHEEKMLIGNI